jgi:S-DNA-T family DNA segregation ATPase FtsK/SpoIIIE
MTKKKKKTGRNAKTFSEAIGFSNIFQNEKIDFLLGLILLGFSVYLVIAMISFLSTGQADQSILVESRAGEWLNTNRQYVNSCGSFGAIISWWLIAENFGLPAFIIPLFLIMVALDLMNAYKVSILKWFFGLSVVMVWCSVAFAKVLTPVMGFLFFNPGGNHGMFIVEKIENLIGAPGLSALLITIAVFFLTILSANTIIYVRKLLRLGVDNHPKIPWTVMTGSDSSENEEDPPLSDDETKDITPAITQDEAEEEIDSILISDEIEYTTPIKTQDQNKENNKENADVTPINVELAADETKAQGKTVEEKTDLSTPINPLEPFLRYKYPTLDLLKKYDSDTHPEIDMDEVKANNTRIIEVLNSFGVKIKEIKATVGPTITLYEVTPAEGVKISKIRSLEDDIALCLSALGVRIIAPIPGKGTVGIEVPNKKPRIVSMESILNSKKFQQTTMDLPIAIGKTITNEVFMVDLAKIPHLLVAGATGQGKSVGLNAIITSLLYKKHPNELKIVLVDPKKVEFSPYAPIADHFMAATDENVDEPIITDVTKVVRTLNSLCTLMDKRYDLLKQAGTKNIKEYNKKFINHKLNPTLGHEYMPYIVVVIDEFGDLIMTAGKEIELPIARIAQLARAVGIHMVIATQRPTTNIITGNIKANFPGRMAFRVGAMIDSRTILDRPGANQLVGRGDMLFLNGGEPVRVQCAFVDTPEIDRINEFISKQSGPQEPMQLPEPASPEEGGSGNGGSISDFDPYFEEAANAIVISQQGSTSMIQRRFSIGFNRAGRLMDQLEQVGIVGASNGSKPRDVLITDVNSLNNLLVKIKEQK